MVVEYHFFVFFEIYNLYIFLIVDSESILNFWIASRRKDKDILFGIQFFLTEFSIFVE